MDIQQNSFPLIFEALQSYEDLQSFLLDSPQKWTQILQITQIVANPRCGRPVKGGDLCFKCLDCCTPEKFDHIFCEKCFRKGDHLGHRIRYRNETYGYCDCGDENYIQKKNFCIDHQEKTVDPKEMKKNIPKDFRQKLKVVLSKIVIKIIEMLEEDYWKQIKKEEIQKLVTIFTDFVSGIVEDNFCFSTFFGDFLVKKIKKVEPSINFYHSCSDLRDVSFSYADKSKSPCSCSILELFFRFNCYFEDEIKEKIIALVYKLSPHVSFKNAVVLHFKNYVNFILKESVKEDEEGSLISYEISIFLKFSLFLNVNMPMVLTFFKENNEILLEKLRKLCQNLTDFETFSNETKLCLDKLFHFYLIRARKIKEKVYEIGMETYFFSEIIKVFISLKDLSSNVLDCKINILELLCMFFDFLKGILKKSQKEIDLEKKKTFGKKFFLDIFKDLNECAEEDAKYMKNMVKNKEFRNFTYETSNISNKIFSTFLTFFFNCFDYNFEQVAVFLEEILGKHQFDTFIQNISQQVILALYMDFLIQNGKNEGEIPMIKQAEASIYSVSGTYFKSCDILSLKFLFLMNKNATISVPAILSFIESKENLNDLRFISEITGYLIFDDLSIINMINRTHSSEIQTASETLFLKNKISFLLINIYHINPRFKFDVLKKIVNINEKELEKYLMEIADYNEKTKNYELKECFKDKFDLFSLPQASSFFAEFYERINSFTDHYKEFSVLLGNIPEPLIKERTELLFEKLCANGMIEAVCQLFTDELSDNKLEKKGSLRLILKILSFVLDMSAFQKNFTFFMNWGPKLVDRVKKLMQNQELKDVHSTLDFLLIKLQKINEKEKIEGDNPKNSKDLKSKQMEKKEKILAEFLLKQKKFMDKNFESEAAVHSQKEIGEKSKKADDSICSICLQNSSKESEPLSYTCFIGKDKIHGLFGSQNKDKSSGVSFYLSSCGHLIHGRCYSEHLKFHKENEMFVVNSEFLCPYCKSLSNLLVPLVKDTKDKNKDKKAFFILKSQSLHHQSLSLMRDEIFKALSTFEQKGQFKLFEVKKEFEVHFKTFFDNLMIATCFELESQDNFACLRFLNEMLVSTFETIHMKNLTAYFLNSRALGSNLLEILLYYMSYSENCKENWMKYKETYTENIKDFYKLFDTNNFIATNVANIHLILINVLLKTFVILSFDENLRFKILKNIIKTFLTQMFIVTTIALSEPSSFPLTFQKILEYFENPDLKTKVMGFLSPYYFIILGMLMTFFQLDEKRQVLVESFLNSDHDIENTEIFKKFESLLAPDAKYLKQFLEDIEFNCNAISQENMICFKQNFLSSNRYEISWINSVSTYEDFAKIFMSKTCEICLYYPRTPKSDLFLCLLCSKVFCNGICTEAINKETGNLTRHTKDVHEGCAVYLNLLKGGLLLFKIPNLLHLTSVFLSKFGLKFNEYSFDLKSFYLDKAVIFRIANAFFNRRYPQVFLDLTRVNPNHYLNPDWKNF